MIQPIKLTYTPQFSDYNALCDAVSSPRARLWELVIMWFVVLTNLALMAFAIIVFDDLTHPWRYLGWSLGVITLILLGHYVGRPMVRKWNFNRLEIGKHPVRMQIDGATIETENALMSAKLNWDAVQRVTKTETHLLLWLNKLQALIVPFAALENAGDKQNLLDLVAKNVKPAKP
jgi:uncharacterized membrane protein YcjF (UPF0283 family)